MLEYNRTALTQNKDLNESSMNMITPTLVTTILMIEAAGLAQQSVTAEVLLLLAKEAPESIDPQLKSIPALKRPPLNSFRSMKSISKYKLTLTVGKDRTVSLPNGRRIRLHIGRVMPDDRYLVKASINQPHKPGFLPLLQVTASQDEPFFITASSYKGGILIVGVSLDP